MILEIACTDCSHSRCSGCVISRDDEWGLSEQSSNSAQENPQGSFEAPQQSSPELVPELSRDELHAVKHSDGQSEHRAPSSSSRDATNRQMQQSFPPLTSASSVIGLPEIINSVEASDLVLTSSRPQPVELTQTSSLGASDKLRVIDSSLYTEAWAADGSHPTLPPLLSGPYVGESFRCQHPGCTAMPFQTQYLLKYVLVIF